MLTDTFPDLLDLTPAAQWIMTTFRNFDFKLLEFYHNLHESCGRPLDIAVEIFTRLGDEGILLILIALILMLFRRTRKFGAGMLGGVIIGAIFTNLTIKNVVARPRPYNYLQVYRDWWESVGHGLESEFSFPSGHATSAMAAMTPLFLFLNKKKSWLCFLFVIVLGATRNYVMVHYPSDILGGILVGGIAGLISYIIVQTLFDRFTEKTKLGQKINSFDLAPKLAELKNRRKEKAE